MTKVKNKRNKKRLKLFKKVRHNSSWGTLGILLFVNLLFISFVVLFAGFFCQYLIETKVDADYAGLLSEAHMYEAANENNGYLEFLEKSEREFIVRDSSGNVIYEKGRNTCSEEGGIVEFSNGSESRKIYKDTEFGLFEADLETRKISFDFWRAIKLAFDENSESLQKDNSIKLPLWIGIRINGGNREFIGKAYFTFNTIKEVSLVGELLASFVGVILVAFVVLIVFMIRSIINFNRVVRLFYADPITGGHNWMWYVMNGDELLQSRKYKKQSLAVVTITFINYRNYCLCHSIAEGEEILVKLNRSLAAQVRGFEMCAHTTMDSFALLLYFDNEANITRRLQTMMDVLQNTDKDHNFIFEAGVDIIRPEVNSSGVIVRRTECSIEKAYNNACTAITVQGETDPGGVFIFDDKLLEEQRWYDIVQEHQMKAIVNNEFEVYYQPKYNPKTLELGGAEALIRWNSPEYGFVSPGRFIPIFEKNGFITEIDHFMIRRVAANQRMWLDMGYKVGCVSVNVSRAHFAEKDLALQIKDMVDAAGCPHDLLEIELTESAFFDDQNAMIETIKALKSFGFKVSMDDFGAGYSSLNSLKDMPLDVLKLDAGFFRGDKAGDRGQIVVSETIKLAKNLRMKTVAEGVDEKEQVDFLASQGCDLIQGYYFAKPMPMADYAAKLTRIAGAQPVQQPVQTAPVQQPAVAQPVQQVQQAIQTAPVQPIQQPAAPAPVQQPAQAAPTAPAPAPVQLPVQPMQTIEQSAPVQAAPVQPAPTPVQPVPAQPAPADPQPEQPQQ